MIIIDLPLNSGKIATFYLTPPFVLYEDRKVSKGSLLKDGIHNNLGWRIDLPLEELKEIIRRAYKRQLGR